MKRSMTTGQAMIGRTARARHFWSLVTCALLTLTHRVDGQNAPPVTTPSPLPNPAAALAPPPTSAELPPPATPATPAPPATAAPPSPGAIPALPTPPRPAVAPRPARRSVGRTPGLDNGMIAEETSADPTKAAEQYRAAIARFDAQRADAAQAVFRLGECLRKLGRMEEAKVQYARILREFVDEADLVELSRKRLSDSPASAANQLAAPGSPVRESVDNLIAKEMDLVRDQLSGVEARVANGVESSAALLPLRRELLRLEQERAIRAQPDASYELPSAAGSKSRPVSAPEEDLRAVESELRKQKLELQKFQAVKNMIEGGPAENMTARIIDDPRFQKLKQAYENQVTNAALPESGEGAKESVKQEQRRLQTWVNEIYLPELRSSIEFAEKQIQELSAARAQLDDKIRMEQAEQQKIDERVGGSLRGARK